MSKWDFISASFLSWIVGFEVPAGSDAGNLPGKGRVIFCASSLIPLKTAHAAQTVRPRPDRNPLVIPQLGIPSRSMSNQHQRGPVPRRGVMADDLNPEIIPGPIGRENSKFQASSFNKNTSPPAVYKVPGSGRLNLPSRQTGSWAWKIRSGHCRRCLTPRCGSRRPLRPGPS